MQIVPLRTITQRFLQTAPQPTTLAEKIKTLTVQFQQNNGKWITSNCQLLQEGSVRYYGIHKKQQYQKNMNETRRLYKELKSHILQYMDLSPDTHVIQVVGDSAAFSPEGTKKAKSFLKNHLKPENVILYGYTGHAEQDGTRCVNAAVSDIITEKNMLDHVIGNVVGFHTPIALTNWGCSGPLLKHYVIVYGDDESCREQGTVFGDDVIASDYFADQLLMLDGGAQSFRQACHAFLLGQETTIYSGLRAPLKASSFEVGEGNKSQIKTPYFNASQFIQEIEDHMIGKGWNEEDLKKWYSQYFGQGKCYIGDPKRGDFDTKQKLMDEAWNLFIEHKLYLKTKHPLASKVVTHM